jgi:membrane fusion protein, copper/silver efflux system
VRARIELANAARQLLPGMFVSVNLSAHGDEGLLVPSEAVIATGQRNMVIVSEAGGKFRATEVELGPESAGMTLIRRGLAAGQKVVASGQFLLDSEASLKGSLTRLGADSAMTEHHGSGRIEAISTTAVTLSHEAITELQWGAMTMEFAPPPNGMPAGLKPGSPVEFSFVLDASGRPVLTAISARRSSAISGPDSQQRP